MEISKILSQNKLVIFAGSGVSKNLELPDWNKMVINIINKINNDRFKSFIPLLDNNIMSAIDVLEYLKSEKKEVYDYINSNFKVKEEVNSNLHKLLLELSNNKIITTNYDNAFEKAANYQIKISKPTSKYTVNEINKSEEGFIFKIHGSYDEPDNCIIFKEDYETLYSIEQNQAAPEKLKILFSDCTFLFIGFSFNDPEINLIFDKIDKIFGGLNKHFIITTEAKDFEKFKFLDIIEIENYSFLENKIAELIELKNKFSINEVQTNDSRQQFEILNKRKKIAILYPEIIDQNFSIDYKNTISCFEDINADLLIGYLNLRTLNLIDEYDLLIIISNTYKGKIYIEENNLKNNLFSLDEILDNIPNSKIPIILLTNEEIDISNSLFPIVNLYNYKNQTIKKFLHKVAKDKIFSFNERSIKSNINSWSLDFEKGKASRNNLYGNNRNLDIGKKCLTEVIGRVEEQANLISRLLIINNSNKILNIKASGGLGKTTLAKKIAYELYNRGYYIYGVNFKSCENVKCYDDFEDLVIEGFNFKDILNFKEHLIENYSSEKIDLLLILDNFETVNNNLNEEDYLKVITLLEFVSDYTNIIITSREVISNKEFEDVFTLTPMTTDDALELFKDNYKGKRSYSFDEIKILREEILEDLLANNPLAIKLVTSSRPVMSIEQLRDQIKEHFFESINEEYSDVFKNNADLNIERTKSIFQSINYSYTSLNTKQKLAFELLSLFPDGINLTDFKKCFQKSKSSNQITDTEIKQLENKSLLENYNGVLQLQPIIRRFADYQFNKHKENRQKYCIDAYSYCCYILKAIEIIQKKNTTSYALKVFTNFKNNLLQVLEYIPDIQIDEKGIVPRKEYILNYIYDLDDYLTNNRNIKYFKQKLNELIIYFDTVKDSDKLIKTLIHRKDYYHYEFDNSYIILSNFFPADEIVNRISLNESNVERRWKDNITQIHSMEGYTIQYLEYLIKNQNLDKDLFFVYHYLGIENIEFFKKSDYFYYFENNLRVNKLNTKELKEHINALYMEEHLQLMQCTYILSKIEKIPIKKIKKLVVTNPYTNGLKNLMFAFNTDNQDEKIKYFEQAIKNLQHIKYYYLEAIYYYAEYLKFINSEKYEFYSLKGLNLSQKYKYQYLDHLFNNLINETSNAYSFSYSYYDLVGLEEFVKKDMENWEEIQKTNLK